MEQDNQDNQDTRSVASFGSRGSSFSVKSQAIIDEVHRQRAASDLEKEQLRAEQEQLKMELAIARGVPVQSHLQSVGLQEQQSQ